MEQPKTGDAQSAAAMNYGLMDNDKHFIMSCSSSKTNLQANKVFNEESIQWIDSWRVWDTVEIGRRDHT